MLPLLSVAGSQSCRLPQTVLAACLLAWALNVPAAVLTASILERSGQPVADAVVTATPVDAKLSRGLGETEGIIDQVDKTFVPYVTVVRVGTRVRFPNSDNIRHHVYSFSSPKRFELPLYSGKAAAPVLFDKPGIVVMGCNIHDWMVGYVYVVETPYFGKTERDGTVQLRDLAPGDYIVQVWHPEMEVSEQTTARTVRFEEQAAVAATWTIDLQPALRPRRAPVPGIFNY
jgi:plastocyanin